MDTIEATKMVMSRIQNIDPENASKIMGYILIQDQGQNEIIRLAFGPENLLTSVVNQAKAFLDHSPSGSFRSSPRSPSVVNGGGGGGGGVEFLDQIVSRSDFPYPNSASAADWSTDGDHRRSCLVNDNDDVSWWKPCMYFARGFCKNGTSCKFVHNNGNGFGDELLCLGSSSPAANVDGFEDFLRIKAIQQQQQQMHQFSHTFPFNRCINFANESPRSPSAAAMMMMGEDIHKFGRFRPERHDLALAAMGFGNSSARQIYLTFPADSTFKEEDVSNYFSMFGPVQDVRIPYQQKRMFGFVTFVLPETVKAILAKGNPHFVCDSRVLVKPYKEKGKIPDKKYHQHQIERGDFSALESAEPFDHIPFGARMFNHDTMLRKKLEGRVELQQAIEFQERNLMNLHLTTDVVSGGKLFVTDEITTQKPVTDESDSKLPQDLNNADITENNSSRKESPEHQSFFDHALPDNLFASPTKTRSTNMLEADDANIMKSCYFHMPRSVCGQEASH